jgi:16S rRNA C967 or C1407 C5-methylase (RsmB/RsmF family)
MKYASNPEEWPLPKSEFPEAVWRTHCSEQIEINLEHYLTFDRVWLVPDGANLQQLEHALKKRGIPILDKDEELKTVQVNTEEITDWQGEKPWRVQDYGARSLVMTLPIEKRDLVWDCCAGSGGKSLSLLHKTNFLNVSDKRKKVLEPLMKRSFSGKQVKVDSLNPLVNKSHEFMNAEYDWIVADVPCSGSGTWRKNPEHFIGFGSNQIKDYQTTQRKIVESLIPVMSEKTKLVYMTCSVFSEENEGQLDFFKSLGLNVQKSEYICDAKRDSDQFYRCILVKSE